MSVHKTVDVQGLTKVFGDFKAVDGVDFEIRQGGIFGFLGPNGAGKSTVIRMLLGIIKPTQGRGLVLGYNILTESEKIRAKVGYMAQRFSLYEDLTPQENLDFFAGLSGLDGKDKNRRIEEVSELVRLRDFMDHLTVNLPGGARQKLALAVTLLHRPELVFLDEPTGNVDPELRRYFWELIVDLSQSGKTVMVTSHHMDEVERCDNICFIHSGKLIGQGSPRQLKENTFDEEILILPTERRNEALRVLNSVPGVSSAFPAGSTIRFLFSGSQPELEKALAQENFPSKDLKKGRANLEDVFIHLTRKGA